MTGVQTCALPISGKEGRKPDALTRRPGDIPTTEEKKLGKRWGILLPKETCWDILEEQEVKIEEIELAEYQDKDEGKIQQAYNKGDEIQAIKKNLEKGITEMKGIALELWNGKMSTCGIKAKSGYQTTRNSGRVLYAKTTTTP